MSLLNVILKILPEPLRHHLIRKHLPIRPIQEPDIVFQVADTREDLEAAFSLLHDCYIQAGLMDAHPSGLRCTVYTALPYTTTIIAKKGDRVIGTVGLIKDSPLGFPSDKEYRAENDRFRKKGYQMVEVSALAVHADYRQDHRISLHLMKYLYEYSHRYMGCDLLCATIHPRAQDFYAGLLGFRRNGGVVQYQFVKGALAVHMTLDLAEARFYEMPRIYRGVPRERDLFHFMTEAEAPFKFPVRKHGCVLDPVMTPEMLKHFFVERTDLLAELPQSEVSLIRSAYELNFDPEALSEVIPLVSPTRDFRFPMEVEAVALSGERVVFGKVQNLSKKGMFFVAREPLRPDVHHEVIFNLGQEHFRLPFDVRWERPSGKDGTGYGLEFRAVDLRLVKCLRQFHHSRESVSSGRAKAA